MLRTSTVCCQLPPQYTGRDQNFFFFAQEDGLGQEEVQGENGVRRYTENTLNRGVENEIV